MITTKREPKIADLEKEISNLEQDIRETEYITKTAVLRMIKDFKNKVITYDTGDKIEIPDFMRV